jgi:predicted transcriptional regulator
MAEQRTMTIRLDENLAADLDLIAQCDGESTAVAIRAAVMTWIEHRRADPNVQTALQGHIDRAARLARPTGGED